MPLDRSNLVIDPPPLSPSLAAEMAGSKHMPITQAPSFGIKMVSAGLAACFADLVTFPLDTAKVRLQIQGEKSATSAPPGRPPTSGQTHPTTTAKSPFKTSIRRFLTQSQGGQPRAILADSWLDTTKKESVQFKYRGIFRTIYVISAEEGVRALYNGIVAGLQRQICFASVRIGCYDSVKQAYTNFFYGGKLPAEGSTNITIRILAGITTGGGAVCFAQPTDVVKIRMQAQQRGGLQAGTRYRGTFHAYQTIAKTEGFRGLWKGVLPNITRNATVNAAELVAYDIVKESILRRRLMTDNMPCHFVSAFGAGFCATVVASPVDVVKTRYMNSAKDIYRGATHCAVVMYREGGMWAFYKGFMPSFVRLGSWNIVMFVTFEQLKRFFVRQFPSSS